MKVKLGQLADAGGTPGAPGPLSKLMDVEDFSVRVSYRLAKLAKLIDGELTAFNRTKDKLIEKYGSAATSGPGKSITPEKDADNWPVFVKEYSALLNEEVELDVEPVVLPPEARGVTPAMLVFLDGLVTVRGEESGPTKVVE